MKRLGSMYAAHQTGPMPDAITRLNNALAGRYRIERELGEGGMAVVYLAQDQKHERRVALKVLKPDLAAVVGPERFLAEIKTTANLQHPHILPLFDSGEADGFLFYVMPFIEGETVKDRLDRERQLPVDEAVQITRNVAEALDYAHRRGIVHRDIKPANILLQDGKPLLSDFGIALAVGVAAGNRLTETGLSVGTPHYMSPEQATGDLNVGAATDIYALGCVLYEMLVGEPPYTGSTPQAILGKILTAEPVSATSQRRSVPPNVDVAIRRALERLPADRFRSITELARALSDPDFRQGEVTRAAAASPAKWRQVALGLVAVTALLAAVVAWMAATRPRPEPRAVARFNVTPTGTQRLLRSSSGVDFALSPDGSFIVYVGHAPGGGPQLWLRRLADLDAVPVPGTEGGVSPDVSPDGQSVAFVAQGAIRTISLQGGPATTVVPQGGAPAWGPDGTIYFNRAGTVHRATAGGEAEAVTDAATNTIHRYVDILPDGAGFLLTVSIGPPAQSRIAVVGPDGGAVREILTGAMARYAPSGHVIYATASGSLMAAPFDVRQLAVTGPSVALLQGVAVDLASASQFAISESGTLVYRTGGGFESELVWVSREGRAQSVDSAWVRELGSPVLSPDGSRVAVAIQGESSMDVWVKQLDRGPSSRLTFEGSRNDYPAWTHDGRSVGFTSNRTGPGSRGVGAPGTSFDLWTRRADASGPAELLLDEDRALAEVLWSPDGQWFIYRTSTNERGAGDIMAVRPGAKTSPVQVATTDFTELAPAISPNGRWLAYSSTETGRSEVFVVPFPESASAKWPVSVNGGSEPAWSRDGRELFFRSGAGDMVSVRVSHEPTFSFGPIHTLFQATRYASSSVHRQYDVSPDGSRFIMLRPAGGGSDGQLVLIQHFLDELNARVPR